MNGISPINVDTDNESGPWYVLSARSILLFSVVRLCLKRKERNTPCSVLVYNAQSILENDLSRDWARLFEGCVAQPAMCRGYADVTPWALYSCFGQSRLGFLSGIWND